MDPDHLTTTPPKEGRTGEIVPLTSILLLSEHGIALSWESIDWG